MNKFLSFSSPMRSPQGSDESGASIVPLAVEAAPQVAVRRAGSMNLRGGGTGGGDGFGGGGGNDSEDSPLDPANQSLADALKIMLGLLQIGMIVLGGLYAVSGLQSVKEGEQGIRLLFGQKDGPALEPGLRISAPYPLGELLKVSRGFREIAIDKDFWVFQPEGSETTSIEKMVPTASLKPDQGGTGSVLTGDGNIAHTKWRVGYRRDDVAKYAQNVLPEDEDRLVRAAVKRGVVQACAQITIDELLKQSADASATVASRAKAVAQRTLDSFESGILIEQLTLDQTIAPLAVRGDFAKVQAAVSNAAKAIETAEGDARSTLNAVGGEGISDLIVLIGKYEEAIGKKDQAAMDRTLTAIDNVLLGEPAQIDGNVITSRISGNVSIMLNDAKRDRSASITQAKGALARFLAKEEQFNANPLLMIQQEWSDAVRTFMARDTVQITYAPENMTAIRLMLNADPDLQRKMEMERRKREGLEAEQNRFRELERERFRTTPTVTSES